jgi:metal-sulfur cluster biosynthetic enzyme
MSTPTTVPFSRIDVAAALSTVLDPEVGINIVDLGLVYAIDLEANDVRIDITMTSAACPLHGYLIDAATRSIRARIPAVSKVDIDMVSTPEWSSSMMSREAKRQMGWSE